MCLPHTVSWDVLAPGLDPEARDSTRAQRLRPGSWLSRHPLAWAQVGFLGASQLGPDSRAGARGTRSTQQAFSESSLLFRKHLILALNCYNSIAFLSTNNRITLTQLLDRTNNYQELSH